MLHFFLRCSMPMSFFFLKDHTMYKVLLKASLSKKARKKITAWLVSIGWLHVYYYTTRSWHHIIYLLIQYDSMRYIYIYWKTCFRQLSRMNRIIEVWSQRGSRRSTNWRMMGSSSFYFIKWAVCKKMYVLSQNHTKKREGF